MIKNHRPLAAWLLAAVLLTGVTTGANAKPDEPKDLPSWVLLGQSRQLMAEKKYGEAVVLLRQAIARRGVYPEAELELAHILGINGDLRIKEKQLERALDQAGLLGVREDKYNLLYQLAEVRGLLEKPGLPFRGDAQVQVLMKILEDDQVFHGKQGTRNGETATVLASYNRALFERQNGPQGLDRVLFLHRAPLTFSLKAHQQLGRIYLDNHAYEKAVNHYLFALTGIFSRTLDLVEEIDRGYEHKSLLDLFNEDPAKGEVILGNGRRLASDPDFGALNKFKPVREYLEASGAWESLYYLGKAAATYQIDPQGRFQAFSGKETAQRLWQLLVQAAPYNSWAQLAALELKRVK